MRVQWFLLATILTQWWCLVASNKALNLLYWAICAVMYPRIAVAIELGISFGVFVDFYLFACCPGSRWGKTE